MSSIGYLRVRAYASLAQYPLEEVAVTVTASDGTAIAMRLTDRNGLTSPVEIPVPDYSESRTPDPPELPFATVNLYAHKNGYEQIAAENIQIFANTTTRQDLTMVPLSEYPEFWDQTVEYVTPPQNL